MVTASTVARTPHLGTPERRDAFACHLHRTCREHRIELLAWVVLREHYHLVICPEAPDEFPIWIETLHGGHSKACNEEDGTIGRQVWYQYWDTSLWTEGDLWSRVNYVHRNPVKHGYVSDPAHWQWSSYRQSLEWVMDAGAAAAILRFPAPMRLPGDDF